MPEYLTVAFAGLWTGSRRIPPALKPLSARRPIPHLSSFLRHVPKLQAWLIIVLVQSLSPVQLFSTPWAAALWASLSFTISWSLFKLTSIESVMPSNHLVLCRPLLLLLSILPSIRVWSRLYTIQSVYEVCSLKGPSSFDPSDLLLFQSRPYPSPDSHTKLLSISK